MVLTIIDEDTVRRIVETTTKHEIFFDVEKRGEYEIWTTTYNSHFLDELMREELILELANEYMIKYTVCCDTLTLTMKR